MFREHGGDILGASLEGGMDAASIIDFSSSINPEGLAPGARQAVAALLRDPRLSAAYPAPCPRGLIRALSAYIGVGQECVLAGNGSTEFIYLLPRVIMARGGLAMIIEPAFSEYAPALALSGAGVVPFFLREEEGFALDYRVLEKAVKERRPQVLYMANPVNPIGRLVEKDVMLRISDLCREIGAWFVVDEAFIDFNESLSITKEAVEEGHIIVLRSMTKFFALAALRLGYVVGGRDIIERLRPHMPPWSVNALAVAAGIASLSDRQYMGRARAWLCMEGPLMREALGGIKGLKTYPSGANYFTSRLIVPGLNAPRLRELLLKKGLLIRDLSNIRGLGPSFFRVAVKDRESNGLLIRELGDAVAGASA